MRVDREGAVRVDREGAVRVAAAIAAMALLVVACNAGEPAAPPAAVPDGWVEHDFGDGAIAVPAEWEALDPIQDDVLMLREPDPDHGPPFVARIGLTGRDPVPVENLLGLVSAQLFSQFPDVEPQGDATVELHGAEEAMHRTFRYTSLVEGEEMLLEERFVVAWYGEDGQAQLRIGGPAERFAAEQELIDRIVESLRFQEG